MKIDSQQAKKRKVEECITMPEGETEETCKEHIEALKKEMARKTNRNMAVVKELMALTFACRRTAFLKGTMSVGECLESYPALKLPSPVKEEFGRIMGKPNPVKCMANTFKEVWVQKILKYGLTQTVGNSIKASIDEAGQDNPNKKSGNIMIYDINL
ncbi:Hypothetical predicted protein [Paramuricea clavata]|uniref:Uncharacterized protein n=1 Tax=Paramuricea clavata TaxID=317549 RepID=A0A6S7FZI6_PARCT|nr:Hypothetical predicted protein [Paramuricea clavata]